ncbi:unnamed protein product, partial [Sphagnum compactum]
MESPDIIDELTPAADILDIGHEAAYYPPSSGCTSSEISTDFSYSFMGIITDELPDTPNPSTRIMSQTALEGVMDELPNTPMPLAPSTGIMSQAALEGVMDDLPNTSMPLASCTKILSSTPPQLAEVIDDEVLEKTGKDVMPDLNGNDQYNVHSSSSSSMVVFKNARPSSWKESVARGKRRLVVREETGNFCLGGRALPNEIVFKIMGFLPMMSLYRFLFLSRSWMFRIMRLFYTYRLDSPLPMPLLPLVNRFPIFLSVDARKRMNFTFDLVLK